MKGMEEAALPQAEEANEDRREPEPATERVCEVVWKIWPPTLRVTTLLLGSAAVVFPEGKIEAALANGGIPALLWGLRTREEREEGFDECGARCRCI